jgi:curli biogenesis system outer membrane secretion channel CsgG
LADKAVKDVVTALNTKLQSGAIIMVMKTSSTELNLINDVVDQITTAIVQAGKLKVVDRSNQALINAEQQFQLSGNVDDNSAVSIGHQLGARYAVLCWISGTSSSRKLNLRVLDIETSQIADQTNFDI